MRVRANKANRNPVPIERVEEWAEWIEARAELLRDLASDECEEALADMRLQDAEDADEIAEALRRADVGAAVRKVAYLDSAERDTYYAELEGFSDAAKGIFAAEEAAEEEAAAAESVSAKQQAADLAAINQHRRSLGQGPLDPERAGWSRQDVATEARRLRRNPELEKLKRRLMR